MRDAPTYAPSWSLIRLSSELVFRSLSPSGGAPPGAFLKNWPDCMPASETPPEDAPGVLIMHLCIDGSPVSAEEWAIVRIVGRLAGKIAGALAIALSSDAPHFVPPIGGGSTVPTGVPHVQPAARAGHSRVAATSSSFFLLTTVFFLDFTSPSSVFSLFLSILSCPSWLLAALVLSPAAPSMSLPEGVWGDATCFPFSPSKFNWFPTLPYAPA
mmetsp:Transcript_10417/g.28419  ORF Transcript_10417/g.28419 Transcript_10417/m.28419 type:complete len:213 (-) Transcript_10417:510-1148(-)